MSLDQSVIAVLASGEWADGAAFFVAARQGHPGVSGLVVCVALCFPPEATSLCRWFLSLRANRKTRKALPQAFAALDVAPPPRWFRGVSQRLWTAFAVLRHECRPHLPPLAPSQSITTKRTHRLECLLGLSRRETLPMSHRAGDLRQALYTRVMEGGWGLWIDNYFKPRYAKRIHTRNASVDSTALCCKELVRIPGSLFAPFTGYPPLDALVRQAQHFGRDVADAALHRRLVGLCDTVLTREDVLGGRIRVPLDRLRLEDSPPHLPNWVPAELLPWNCSRNTDLVAILECLRKHFTCGPAIPLLVDVNLYYRALKFLYSRSYHHWDTHAWLKKIQLVFGKWHLYKHLVTVVFRRFFPWLARLAEALNPGEPIFMHMKLVTQEGLLAVLLCATAGLKGDLVRVFAAAENGASWCASGSPADRAWKAYQSFRSLLFVVVPFLFLFGERLRAAEWEAPSVESTTDLKEVVVGALLLLVNLNHKENGRKEYIDCTTCALILFQGAHLFLDTGVLTEEVCEASLSRLCRAASRALKVEAVEDMSSIYTLLGTANPPRHLKRANIRPRDILTARECVLKLAAEVAESAFMSYNYHAKKKTQPLHEKINAPLLILPIASFSIDNTAMQQSLSNSLRVLCAPVRSPISLDGLCPVRPQDEELRLDAIADEVHKIASVQFIRRRGVGVLQT